MNKHTQTLSYKNTYINDDILYFTLYFPRYEVEEITLRYNVSDMNRRIVHTANDEYFVYFPIRILKIMLALNNTSSQETKQYYNEYFMGHLKGILIKLDETIKKCEFTDVLAIKYDDSILYVSDEFKLFVHYQPAIRYLQIDNVSVINAYQMFIDNYNDSNIEKFIHAIDPNNKLEYNISNDIQSLLTIRTLQTGMG